MAKTEVLKVEIRQQKGTKDAEKLRKQGRIPAIVYGHKQEPAAITLDRRSFIEGLHLGRRLMDIQLDGKDEKLLIKEVQYDHLGKEIIHVDFMRVDVTEKVTVAIPIEFKGTAKGTHEGGMVEIHCDHLDVECLVTSIPERITVSIKEMVLGDAIHAKDIQLPEGVRLISQPELLMATCHEVAETKSTEEIEEEAPVAPEVITEVERKEREAAAQAEAAEQPKEKKEEKEKK
ncbi:MAG: 50S ribosomal protein L25 [Sedimentisphaerales bacterium]|nr:50S ribosomal protein L25 [Sedimentisphaerales bacterium]